MLVYGLALRIVEGKTFLSSQIPVGFLSTLLYSLIPLEQLEFPWTIFIQTGRFNIGRNGNLMDVW